jgi:hypothetical protein
MIHDPMLAVLTYSTFGGKQSSEDMCYIKAPSRLFRLGASIVIGLRDTVELHHKPLSDGLYGDHTYPPTLSYF